MSKPSWPLGFRELGSGIILWAKEWLSMQIGDSDILDNRVEYRDGSSLKPADEKEI